MSEAATTEKHAKLDALDWIGADWGTSNLRIWAFDKTGNVIARKSSVFGMGQLTPAEFEQHFLSLIFEWLDKSGLDCVDVIICGMAGAREGWCDAGYRYLPCTPVEPGKLSPVATHSNRISVFIVSGLACLDPPDVMRGEETQLAGLVASRSRTAIVCLPGTHSKWVSIVDGIVRDFSTYMTGELFDVIGTHTIIRNTISGGSPLEAGDTFLAAISEMAEAPEKLTTSLFSIRAAALANGSASSSGADAAERLSGLLIGAELTATRSMWEGQTVHLVGERSLCMRYKKGLEHLGANCSLEDGEALTIAGLKQAISGLNGESK